MKSISILIDEIMIKETVVIKEMGDELYEGVSEAWNTLKEQFDFFIVSNCQSGYNEKFLLQNKI